ncbi:MAG: HAD hydrolase-like protein [Candidatus Aenigmarchaeota archaeon]|nr:HAD hydrolase-like protein [Candidatus Aenigmarchaeota archaeon]
MSEFKAVIFDLDGTLVHTRIEYMEKIVNKILGKFNSSASLEEVKKFYFGTHRNKTIKELFGLKPDLFWEEYDKYDLVSERKKYIEIYDDTKFLFDLQKNGFKMGIVTGALPEIAELLVENLGGIKFNNVITANNQSSLRPKPFPDGIEESLKFLKVKKTEAIYVGNADEDVLAAKNAGVYDVLIDRNEHIFIESTPSLKINSLFELKNLLNI